MIPFISLSVYAQENNAYRERFDKFHQEARQEYSDFRDKANQTYVDFMRQAWVRYQALPEVPKPQDEPPLPPTPYVEDDKDIPIEDKPIPVKDIIPPTEPMPQPKPVVPILEQPQPVEKYFAFQFFQTECRVRLNESHRFTLKGCETDELADAWQRLSESEYDNAIRDCLELRIRYQFCDWAYLLMLQELSGAFLGRGTNEATLLCAYLFCQSGYQMRLGLSSQQRLYLLFASNHILFDTYYWKIGDNNYYPLNCNEESLKICEASFPGEKPLSLLIPKEQLFARKNSDPRALQSKKYPEVKAEVTSNENLLHFLDTYPVSMLDGNVCTKWMSYANMPLSRLVKDKLYPSLRTAIEGQTQLEAANYLLNFVQTAFVYEYDDKLWGGDRVFFAEETLYYPFCDCEDRSILFSRLIRDLLGLKVLLVYYPGHLATAVCFTEDIKGDYICLGEQKYIICDPTYIGAPVGKTMPDMDNEKAEVILLQ